MFDVGFWELAIIALIALLILGPERLPRAARTLGHWVGKARRTLAEVKRDIDRELDAAELKEIKSIKHDLKSTQDVFKEAAETLNEKVVSEDELSLASIDPTQTSPVDKPDAKPEGKPQTSETAEAPEPEVEPPAPEPPEELKPAVAQSKAS